jgi:hypothetical protein
LTKNSIPLKLTPEQLKRHVSFAGIKLSSLTAYTDELKAVSGMAKKASGVLEYR